MRRFCGGPLGGVLGQLAGGRDEAAQLVGLLNGMDLGLALGSRGLGIPILGEPLAEVRRRVRLGPLVPLGIAEHAGEGTQVEPTRRDAEPCAFNLVLPPPLQHADADLIQRQGAEGAEDLPLGLELVEAVLSRAFSEPGHAALEVGFGGLGEGDGASCAGEGSNLALFMV